MVTLTGDRTRLADHNGALGQSLTRSAKPKIATEYRVKKILRFRFFLSTGCLVSKRRFFANLFERRNINNLLARILTT